MNRSIAARLSMSSCVVGMVVAWSVAEAEHVRW